MSEANDTLLEKLHKRYTIGAKAQRGTIRQMEHCRLFYRGDQWLMTEADRWVAAPKKPWKVRLTINVLPPAVEGNISVFLKAKPIIVATPATDDEDDIKAARVTEKLLRARWEQLGMEEEVIEALTWKFTAGNAFLRVRWDDTKGRKLAQYETETNQFLNEETGDMEEQDEEVLTGYVREGATVLDCIDPFSLIVEPGARKIEDAAWVIVTEFMLKTEVERRFDKKVKDLKTEVDRRDSETYTPQFLSDTGRSSDSKDRIPVYTMYERPTNKNPKGRITYATRSEILGKEPLPNGEIRIVHLKNLRVPGEFWANSVVGEAIPLQYEYNRIRSQIVENRNLTSRPKLLAPRGSLELDEVTSEPGEILEYDQVGVSEPKWLTPPSIPNYIQNELQWIRQDIDDITSRHEASQGKFSSQISSGKQAQFHQQADTSRYLPQILLFEKALETLGRYIIAEDKEHLEGEQIVRLVGKGLEYEVYTFDMNDVTDTCNIKFEIASQWPWAREQMRQTLYYLHSIGAIDTERMMDLLDTPTSTSIYEADQENKRNAEMENQMLLSGEEFDPLPTDDARAHLKYHLKAINSPQYRKEFLKNREVLNPLMKHMSKHHEMIPEPQAPPMAPKLNISARDLIGTPEGYELILSIVREAMGQEKPAPENPPMPQPGGGRAPGMGGEQGPGGMPTPPGGMDGMMQQGGGDLGF
jgi:hypothetical protein